MGGLEWGEDIGAGPPRTYCRDSDGGAEDLRTVACAGWGRGSLSGLQAFQHY